MQLSFFFCFLVSIQMTIVCQICKRGFPKKYLLKVHMRSHTGDNPYPCDKCGKKFPSSSVLWSHKKFAHFEKVWECGTCGEKLVNRQTLDNHVRMKHTKDRTLRCKVNGLNRLSNLKQKITTHNRTSSYLVLTLLPMYLVGNCAWP